MKCAILTCPVDGRRICCHDCEHFKTCGSPCKNEPEKCGQLVQPKRLKVRTKKRCEITVFALEEKDKWKSEWDKSWNV